MLKKLLIYGCATLLMAGWFVACKTNTKLNRGIAGLTTKYNIHYNGEEAYRNSLRTMEESTAKDDYSKQLKLHPLYYQLGQQPTTQFDAAIDKCKKCIQTKSISTKPKRKAKSTPAYKLWLTHEEFNPYMHNAWLLSGRAQFYNGDFDAAQSTFNYIIRHFWWRQLALDESHIWLARIKALQGDRFGAESELDAVIFHKKYETQRQLNLLDYYHQWPLRLQRLFSLAQAEILMAEEGNEAKALPYLKKARRGFYTRVQRIRADFYMAQLSESLGQYAEADRNYKRIVRQARDYKTQFNARLARVRIMSKMKAGTSKQANPKALRKVERKLNSLRRQARNGEYLDQIYTALAEVSMMQKDTAKAIERYELAIEKSTRGGMEKAAAALSLGELTFGMADYVRAQKAYSTAMGIIKEDYKGYDEIKTLSAVLDELQTHAESVQLQDSLLHLATLDEKELNKVIDRIIEALIEKEKEEAEAEQQAAYEDRKSQQVDPLAQKNTPMPTVGQTDKSWYFYNPSIISQGKSEFQRLWGARKPEDNWRRRNKTETLSFEEETAAADSLQAAADSLLNMNDDAMANTDNQQTDGHDDQAQTNASPGPDTQKPTYDEEEMKDPHQRAYYLSQIPRTEEEVANANKIIEEGLYNEGKIINEKLENFPLAIETFQAMERRYPESELRLETYYAIYLMYMRMNQPEQAEVWKQRLIDSFPASAYGVALADPNYIDNMREMAKGQDSLYIKTYEAYLLSQSQQVHETYEFVHTKWPLSKLMPKFLFLHALSFVQEGDIKAFQEALEQLTATYPDSDVSPLASLMVKGIHEGRNVQTGEVTRGMMWGASLHQATDSTAIDTTQTFVDDDYAPHLLLLAFKTDSISQNDLLFEVAKFNFENYLVRDFDLEIINTGGGISVLVISGFADLNELLDYHDRMDRSQTLLLPDGLVQIDINEPNFRALLAGRTFQDYFEWVQRTYGEGAADSSVTEEGAQVEEVNDSGTDSSDNGPENE